jgi:type I restriction enzyme S subunit
VDNRWPKVTIKDVCESVIDCVNKTAPVVEYETPYKMIRTTNVKKGVVNLAGARFVEKATFDKWTRRAVPRVGDVILTREAPLGDVGMITTPNENIFLGQRLMQYRVDPEKLDAHYLLYVLQGPKLQGQLKAAGSGSTVEHIRVGDAENLEIELPPILDQREIGKVLANYDNLIENNNRRIAILEEMAQSLYREWFVNFRYPGHANQPDGSSDNKYSKPNLIDSPLGPIPEGWEVKKFSSLVNYKTGKLNSNAAILDGEYPFFTCSRETYRTNTYSFDCECVLLAGNNANAIYPIKYFNGKFDAYQRTYVITEKNRDEITPSFLFYCLEIRLNQLKSLSTGSATRFLTKGILDNLDLLVPPAKLMAKFDNMVLVLLNSQGNLNKRNKNLKQQRDMLLPKLISGQIQLKD